MGFRRCALFLAATAKWSNLPQHYWPSGKTYLKSKVPPSDLKYNGPQLVCLFFRIKDFLKPGNIYFFTLYLYGCFCFYAR